MVVTRGGSGPGEGSGLDYGVRFLDGHMREFISSEITCGILE